MGSFSPVDARAVANLLLAKGMAEGVPLDPMKLLKLTYIAHGWTLGLTGESLFGKLAEDGTARALSGCTLTSACGR